MEWDYFFFLIVFYLDWTCNGCFSVSLATAERAVHEQQKNVRNCRVICFISGSDANTAGSVYIPCFSFFRLGKIISLDAFLLLLFIGGKMLLEGIRNKKR